MHTLLNSGNPIRYIRAAVWSLMLLLGACASGPTTLPPTEERPVILDNPASDTSAYGYDDSEEQATPYSDRNIEIQQAQRYQRIAEDDNQSGRIDAALNSAELFIQGDDPARAQQALQAIDDAGMASSLTPLQLYRYQIVIAYIEYAQQNYPQSLARLQRLLDSLVDADPQFRRQQVDALLLSAFCYQRMGQSDQAVQVLIDREALLSGAARAETSRYIGQVINQLPIPTRQVIIASTQDPRVRNRLEQSMLGQTGQAAVLPGQFDRWRDLDPATDSKLLEHDWGQDSPRNITVLLPTSSRFGKAAQAVQDGIEFQHSLNQSGWLPSIEFLDIGDNPSQVVFYYQSAQQRGSDLIIGPLGKDFADALLASGVEMSTPTILLGGTSTLRGRTTRLTMSPERESVEIARRALESGYLNAALLAPATSNGTRAADAFIRAWLARGGKLSKSISYSPAQYDHSTELRLMFDLDQSTQRHREVSETLGFKPEFAEYRRRDIDFIYMIADDKTGRILRPQINFFSGNRVPVFAPSSIYNGIQDQANNLDLERTMFPAMPWVLAADQVAPYAGQLNQLFAMGADAYHLASSLDALSARPGWSIQGISGQLTIDESGETIAQPVWAVFNEGMAEPADALPELEELNRLQEMQPLDAQQNPNERTQYNEQNWDPRESRRRTGN